MAVSDMMLRQIEESLGAFGVDPDDAGESMAIVGLMCDLRAKTERTVEDVFRDRLSVEKVRKALDAANAVIASSNTPEQLGAARRLATMGSLHRG